MSKYPAGLEVAEPRYDDGPEVSQIRTPRHIYSFPTRRQYLTSDEAACSFPAPTAKPTRQRQTLCGIYLRTFFLIAFLTFAVVGLTIASGVAVARASSYSRGPTDDPSTINGSTSTSVSYSISRSSTSISSGSIYFNTTPVPLRSTATSSDSAPTQTPATALSSTATSSGSAPTGTPATDGGCKGPSRSANGTFYMPSHGGKFQMFCSIDYPGVSNMLGVMSPSFEACMEVCASWNNLLLESTAIPCSGVVFIPAWYNATGHVAKEEASNCFLKKDLKSTSQLVINPNYETDVAFKL